MKSVVLAVFASLVGLSSFGLTTNNWQAVSGVWDGNWNDPNHWSLGTVPNSTDQYVRFDGDSGASYTITVDAAYEIGAFEYLKPESGVVQTTLKGSGSISAAASTWSYIRENHSVTHDGVNLTIADALAPYNKLTLTNGVTAQVATFIPWLRSPSVSVYDGCSLTVTSIEGSRTTMTVYAYTGSVVSIGLIARYGSNANPTRLVVEGGTVTVDEFKSYSKDSGATVNAGTLTIKKFAFSVNTCRFELNGGTTTFGPSSKFIHPLRPEWFTVGANAMLKIAAGTTYFLATDTSLSPAAKVTAFIPEDLAPAGYMILRGWRDDTLTAAQRESVTLEGATEGWALNTDAGGHVVAWKRATVGARGTSTYLEWTGAAGDGLASTLANWSNGTAETPTDYPHSDKIGVCLGASDKTSISAAGATVRGFDFLDTAVNSYTYAVPKDAQVTLYTTILYSHSVFPQYLSGVLRSARGTGGMRADSAGALYIGSSENASIWAYKYRHYYSQAKGDIRLRVKDGATSMFGLQLVEAEKDTGAPFTRVTADCGTVTVTNVLDVACLAVAGAAFDVEQGATLVYAAPQATNVYQWTAAPSDCRINGTFDIQAALVGGVDQTYGGSGVLKTAEIRPDATGDTAVSLQDTLTLAPAQDWTTTRAAAPSNVVRLAVTAGNPSIRLAADWTYGPGAGTTETSRDNRSLVLNFRTSLTVDAGGHRATFKDYLTGRGTLIATNGTVKLDYAAGTRTNFKVCDSGVLEWTGSNTVASVTVLPGGTLRPLAAVPFVFPSAQGAATATLTGSFLDVDRALLPVDGSWLTVLRAEKGVTGLPTMTDEGLRCRVKNVGGYDELQVREKKGLAIILR